MASTGPGLMKSYASVHLSVRFKVASGTFASKEIVNVHCYKYVLCASSQACSLAVYKRRAQVAVWRSIRGHMDQQA